MGPSPARESFWKGWGAARLSRDQLVVGDPGGWSLSNDSGSIVEDVDLCMDGWMDGVGWRNADGMKWRGATRGRGVMLQASCSMTNQSFVIGCGGL